MATFTIPSRFNGPPSSANGGFACGVLAGLAAPLFGPLVAVTLHAPPPLDTELEFRQGQGRAHAWLGEELIATVAPSAASIDQPEPVPFEVAADASGAYRGRLGHPFPTCFVCGVDRPRGDGMRLAPGALGDRPGTVACPWVPDASVATPAGTVPREIVWAALDCPGGWTGDPLVEPMVLGRMAARISSLPRTGRRCVVVARQDERRERTALNTSALYDEDGRALARASALWVAMERSERRTS
jgi:hypothetical protein